LNSQLLPEKSEGSIKNGIWFVYEDGSNLFHIWISAISGKEKIYLNGQIVSEGRTVKKNSALNFQDSDGANYEVKFKIISLVKGTMMCSLIKNGELIKTFKSTSVQDKKFNVKRFLIIILASIPLGLLPFIVKNIFIVNGLVMIYIIMLIILTRKPVQFIIEE
jgi:hypothetical protein